jgi:hypothetical protein
MKIFSYFLLCATLLIISCKGKKDELDKQDISVLSIIKGQINHLDTSFYQIKKIETKDGKTDSSFLKREEVRSFAKDFLSLPDITGKNFNEKYTEEKLIDNSQNSLSIISTAKNDELEIRKQIIIVPINELATGKVQSIFFDRYVENKDSSIEQKLFWQVDKFFQIGTIIVKGNQPEKVNFLKVSWE